MPLYVMARCASRTELDGTVLTAYFDKQSYAAGLSKPQNSAIAHKAMEGIQTGVSLRFVCGSVENPALERAKELFGDRLEIVD